MQAIEFIKHHFREYYSRRKLKAPYDLQKREFGFGDIKKIDYRHISFQTEAEMAKHFIDRAPLYASYSAAYYEFPSARPMPRKSMLCADLIFEFDVHSDESIAPEKALQSAKEQTFRLIEDFLVPDFGIGASKIFVNFSGNRGYHIHVFDPAVQNLDAKARREIIDYIKPSPGMLMRAYDPSKDYGWHRKIRRGLAEYFDKRNANEKAYRDYGMKKAWDTALVENRETLMRLRPRDGFKESVNHGMEAVIQKNIPNLTADVDEPVTFDMARLLRMPDTLHGGSGLLAMTVKNLDSFNPFRDALVFYNPPVKIKVLQPVKEFILNDETFGPYREGGNASVPQYAALYMVCKGVAEAYEL